jgi:ornithine carbamoyltransferase
MPFLKTKDILTLAELNNDQIFEILSLAIDMKNGDDVGDIFGKTLSLIFKKPSTRTRVSFEAGIYQLGGFPIYLHSGDLQIGRGESIDDTGKVLSRYTNAIVMRTFEHGEIEKLAESSQVSVINALTDQHHPCQALADLMTIYEAKGHLKDVKVAYIGDGNNVCNSLLIASKITGINICVASPKGFEPKDEILKLTDSLDGEGTYKITGKPFDAVKNADVVYTDVWVSMGEENLKDKKERFEGFQVNSNLMSLANEDAVVMHCLPAHRGEEITADVIDGKQSVVFDQAENRLHSQKALILGLIGNE